MSLQAYVRRAFELPPHVVAGKAVRLAARLLIGRARRWRDLSALTYATSEASDLVARLAVSSNAVPASLADILPELCRRYIDHQFDLLGSGWVQVRHGMTPVGVEGHRYRGGAPVNADPQGDWLADHVTAGNLAEAQRLWRLIEAPYQPIDWQIDFKSGFRWNGRSHFRGLTYGDVAGADVKVPWELARLQHLPQLATAHLLAKSGRAGFADAAVYANEVRNQILDFLASNPPRFGVNWLCPMDVGIRIANILVAVDLLRAGGLVLDDEFSAAVANSAISHGRHIIENLEWSSAPRSNHYLANIAGLMFCAIYLPASDETDQWLDFAAQQLGYEVFSQFLADGGNVEGSTSYHRLSAELVLFSVAALLGASVERQGVFDACARRRLRVRVPLEHPVAQSSSDSEGLPVPLPAEAIARLGKAIDCVARWSKPDGRPPQIGDNDSGRLFKLHPTLIPARGGELHEDVLDHRAVVATGAALFAQPLSEWNATAWFDAALMKALAGRRTLKFTTSEPAAPFIGTLNSLDRLVDSIQEMPAASRRETFFNLPGLIAEELTRTALPDFGLFVFRSRTSFISLRSVASYSDGSTLGHFHDDNLAIELHHDGKNLITDPGSYLYTPLPDARERYRSVGAHFAPRPVGHESSYAISPFAMRFTAISQCVYFGVAGIGLVLKGNNWRAYRAVLVEDGGVRIIDGCTGGYLRPNHPVAISEGYGRLADNMSFVSMPNDGQSMHKDGYVRV